MSYLFDENESNEGKHSGENTENINELLSLEKEPKQPENTSEIQFNTSTADEIGITAELDKKIEKIDAAVKADYENSENGMEIHSLSDSATVDKVGGDAVPGINAETRENAVPQPAAGYYNEKAANPYQSNASVMNNPGEMPAYSNPVKPKMGSGLKAYLIIISGLTVIFLLGFIFECVRTYNENGVFGGDLDRFIDFDTDYGYNFDFGIFGNDDSDDSDEMPNDSDGGFGIYDFTQNNGSDNEPTELKEAPDKSTVVNKEAANIGVADQPKDIDEPKYTAKEAFKKVENSVVNVIVFEGDVGDEDLAIGSGTGIIVSEDGYIVTNSHVLNDSASYGVEIILNNERTYVATVVGFDARTDIAVVKIDAHGLIPAEFVNSDQIEVGQDAIAVGNPGGKAYSHSLTKGCVSALNRTISSNKLVSYIQTDAAINPGNSGGPLLNSAGQVMGITTIKIVNTDYEGMGFAIPSNTTVSIINDLIGQGYVSDRVRLGIVGTTAYGDSSYVNLPEGIAISEFADDSPLKNTEAQVNDIITAIDGQRITSFAELFSVMANYQPGDEAVISLYRPGSGSSAGKSFEVKITFIADNGETQNN